MNKINQLVILEKALLKNEALVSSLCAKWHGKPENIAKDIYIIANTLHHLNLNNGEKVTSNLKLDKFNCNS